MLTATSLLLLSLLAPPPAPDSIKTGEDLVRAMHARYAGKWYRSLSFVQRVIWGDGRPEEEWWEAAIIPGRLRIDMAPVDSGNGVVYRNDTLFRYSKRALASSGNQTNWLLVLGFDIYGQPPEKTIEKLRNAKFDLTKLRRDTWEGRPAYVVGADAGDEKSLQFWVDTERMLFLRLIQSAPNGAVSDIRFTKYEPLGRGWIAPEVVFIRDGKEFMREVYRDMRADPKIGEDLFAGPPWKRAAWVPNR